MQPEQLENDTKLKQQNNVLKPKSETTWTSIFIFILFVSNALLWFFKASDLFVFKEAQRRIEANNNVIDTKIDMAIFDQENKQYWLQSCKNDRARVDSSYSQETEQGKRLILGEKCVEVLYGQQQKEDKSVYRFNDSCELLDKNGNKLNLNGDDKLLIKGGSLIEVTLDCFSKLKNIGGK